MSVIVKGEQVRLLDLSMIRRYGSPTPILDPGVAKVLVQKGFAIYLNNKEEVKEKKVIKKEKLESDDDPLFPKEIIDK